MKDDDIFSKWVDQWAKAEQDGVFADAPKPPVTQADPIDYFGNWAPKKEVGEVKDVDAEYWRQVYKVSIGEDPQTLNEENKDIWEKPQTKELRELPTKDNLGTKAAELGNTMNPIHPNTRGMDQRRHVTPNWSDSPKLQELTDMKYNLYQLEGKLNASPKFGAYGPEDKTVKNIQGQIDELKTRIDKLSNSLSPDFLTDENS